MTPPPAWGERRLVDSMAASLAFVAVLFVGGFAALIGLIAWAIVDSNRTELRKRRESARRKLPPREAKIVATLAAAHDPGAVAAAEAALLGLKPDERDELVGSAFLAIVDAALVTGALVQGSADRVDRWAARFGPTATDAAAAQARSYLSNAVTLASARSGALPSAPPPPGMMLQSGEHVVFVRSAPAWEGTRIRQLVGSSSGASVNVGYGVTLSSAASAYTPVERKQLKALGDARIAITTRGVTVIGREVVRVLFGQVISVHPDTAGLALNIDDQARPSLLLGLHESDAWLVSNLLPLLSARPSVV